jgi:DNA repair photolyase
MAAVRALSTAGVVVGVFASPVMPGLNDAMGDLEAVARAAADAGARRFGANPLFLKPCALRVFMPFVEERYPWLARAYAERYGRRAYVGGQFSENVERMVAELKEKFGFAKTRAEAAPEWGQMALFAETGVDH